MKKLITLTAILFSFTSFADYYEFDVNKMKETMREGVFKLDTGGAYKSVRLDCASFVHGIYFFKKTAKTRKFFYLYEAECKDLQEKFTEHLKAGESLCLILDYESHSYSLNLDGCSEGDGN